MDEIIYRIVEHDGGWAYKLGDVFSETFPTRAGAQTAADRAAAEQGVPGDTETISWQDEAGRWHEEEARGSDRPHAVVAGEAAAPAAALAPRQPPSASHLLLACLAGALLAVLVARRRGPSEERRAP